MNINLKREAGASAVKPLAGKVSLVTGSTSGIELGIARALAQAGSTVVLNGLGTASEIENVRQHMSGEFGVEVGYSAADMTKPAAIAEMIAATVGEHRRLDVLVNNAGIQYVAPLDQFPVEKWDAILSINLSSAFHTIRLALPAMRQNKFGRIINIVSAHGLVASPFKAAYVAAKHGIIGLTKVAALETAQEGITCNAICPGYVYTPLVEAQIDNQAKAHGVSREEVIRDVLLAQQPNKRFATVEQLGALTLFLASLATRRPRSPVSHCQWMAAGRPTEKAKRPASAHSLVASPIKSAYVAAKHGVAGFTKTVALELAKSGITCNCISPGYVWTPLVEKQIPETINARHMSRDQVINDVLLAAQPPKQFVTVEQVASLALFLRSDDTAQITGANLCIDGGWTAA
jgi:3-hydroxybutyrate dehydrogenase